MITITKATIVDFFSKTKVIFATIAAIITFSITMYNQFKGSKTTEISGIVALDNVNDPVDAVVRISSPISGVNRDGCQGAISNSNSKSVKPILSCSSFRTTGQRR
jgi:hypothetical protein